jgi:prepilin-type N-terminal cleavage/methylation domain-containing protein
MPCPRVTRGEVGRAHRSRSCGGFTLTELLIVIAIIAVLAGIALPIVSGGIQATRKAQCASNLGLIATKLGEYAVDHREFPESIDQLYPDYISQRNALRCPNDPIKGRTTYDIFYAQRFPNESGSAIAFGCAFHPRERGWIVHKGGEMQYVSLQSARVHGNGEVKHRDSAEWIAGDNEVVRAGDAVRTAYGCLIQFEDGTVLTLGQDTEALIAILASTGNGDALTVVGMYKGALLAEVKKLVTRDSTFEVSTPGAVTGVRGTVFGVSLDLEGNTTVSVYEGAVKVKAWTGEQTTLKEGRQKTVRRHPKRHGH